MDNPQFRSRLDEEVLWNAVQHGDHQSFHLLYTKYSDFLFNYGRKICKDREIVKDSIQEVFKIIWEKKKSINIKSSLKYYVFTIFRRELIQKIKYQEGQNQQSESMGFELSIESKIILEESQQLLRTRLEKAITNLSHRQKEILFLRYYENLSYTEISELMSLNKNSMYKLLSTAIQRLKDECIILILYMSFVGNIWYYLYKIVF